MSKPTFILVHGAWHSSGCWLPVTQVLELRGYKCIALDLPGVIRSPSDKPTDGQRDVDMVRKNVLAELDRGNDVVLVCHSWGGVISSSALRDLDSEARSAAGFETSVIGIAAISAFMLLEGKRVGTALGPFTETNPRKRRLEGPDLVVVNDPGPVHYFYHDLPVEEAEKWAATLHPHSLASINDSTTYSPYGKIPTHYLICTRDRAIHEEVQKYLVQQIRDQGFKVRTEEVDAGHSPFLSHIEKTSDFLRRCAGE